MEFFVDNSSEHLDLSFILDKIKVHTPYGLKKKKEMGVYHLRDIKALNAHYDLLDELLCKVSKRPVLFKKIRQVFAHFKTLDLTLDRLKQGEVLSVTELFEIKSFTWHVHQLLDLLKEEATYGLQPMPAIMSLLDPEGLNMPSFYIYDAYSQDLKDIRDAIKQLDFDLSSMKLDQKKALEVKYKISIRPNREITLSKEDLDLCERLDKEEEIVYVSETWMHRTYKVKSHSALLEKENSMEDLKRQASDEEYRVLQEISKELAGQVIHLKGNMLAIGHLDLLLGQVYFIKAYNLCRPEIIEDNEVIIQEGVHLKTAQRLGELSKAFVPISLHLKEGVTCITGANMGGKTIGLQLLGQMITMAQHGLYVPCRSFQFKPQAFCFIASQDGQTIDRGLSTFGAEMVAISKGISRADEGGLILMDELARGTNPKEGFAISKAIINHLKTKASITVLTTHLDGLADEKDILHLQVRGLKDVNFEDLEINWEHNLHEYMDYRLQRVDRPEEVPKDAIKIAKIMGLESSILDDANKIVEDKEAK